MNETGRLIERCKEFDWHEILAESLEDLQHTYPQVCLFIESLLSQYKKCQRLTFAQQKSLLKLLREKGTIQRQGWYDLEEYSRDLADWQPSSRPSIPTDTGKSTSDLTGPERQGHSALEEASDGEIP